MITFVSFDLSLLCHEVFFLRHPPLCHSPVAEFFNIMGIHSMGILIPLSMWCKTIFQLSVVKQKHSSQSQRTQTI